MGKFLRERYRDLLGTDEYSLDLIYVQSTDVDRTLMSAQANLAGLFPPSGDQIWNENLIWQPIPVHTIPEELDGILAAKKPCPRYSQALKNYEETPEFKTILNKYQDLFKYLQEHTGKSVKSLKDVQSLYTTLFIEQLRNYT